MTRATTTRLAQPILWVAVLALLLAAISNHMRMTVCVGDCCAVEAISCCRADAPTTATDGECCGCCGCRGETGDDNASGVNASGDNAGGDNAGGDRDEQPQGEQPDSTGGTCAPGCCVTLAFDIEMAPSTESSTVDLEPLAGATTPPTYRASQPRAVIQTRPFDRGPPRIDRRTAMRACVVLLI